MPDPAADLIFAGLMLVILGAISSFPDPGPDREGDNFGNEVRWTLRKGGRLLLIAGAVFLMVGVYRWIIG